MPIRFILEPDPVAVFEASCVAEDADGLLEFLVGTPDAVVDLQHCDELHTALLQTLLATRTCCLHLPRNAIAAACLTSAGLQIATTPVSDRLASAGPSIEKIQGIRVQ